MFNWMLKFQPGRLKAANPPPRKKGQSKSWRESWYEGYRQMTKGAS
jgi:hypothetical protein